MLRSQNSPLHRSGNLLCSNLSGRTKCLDRSSGYLPSPQHLELSSIGEQASSSTSPTLVTPMVALDGDFYMFNPMDSVTCGYYAPPPSTYTSDLAQFSGYYPTIDGSLAANAYNSFLPTSEPLDNHTHFSAPLYVPQTTHQSPIPPAPQEEPIPLGSGFYFHTCRWLGGARCDGFAPGRNREMGEHLRGHHRFVGHERDTVQCEWENCGQTMQRMNVPRHIVSRHLLAAASCRFCGKRFSRPDVVARHERTCSGVLAASGGSAVII